MTRDDKRPSQPRQSAGERDAAREARKKARRAERRAQRQQTPKNWPRNGTTGKNGPGIAGRSQRPFSGEKTRDRDGVSADQSQARYVDQARA